MKINRLVLASTSVYRLQLLEQVGIPVSAERPNCDESAIGAASPRELAARRSEAKSLALPRGESQPREAFLAIGADQVLDFRSQSFGKAANREEALARLELFQGSEHRLESAYSLALYQEKAPPKLLLTRVISARMLMRKLSREAINAYLDTGEWQGCAGCYQYENRGMQLFDRIEGDLSTVIGLPLPALIEDLRTLGLDFLLQPRGPWTLNESWEFLS